MPDKPITVLTYAASASLAAVALVYFFNPNQLIDGESSLSSASTRKKGIVGLVNPANDCFINSVLQALAGLGDLRLYLIRETHRRQLDDASIYAAVPEQDEKGKEVDTTKLASLQSGEVTQGLKSMLDQLNERPIYRKTISAQGFVRVLERAFGTRISKAQQDAQELLQIVAERLNEEYHAGYQARRRARKSLVNGMKPSDASLPQEKNRKEGLVDVDPSIAATVISKPLEQENVEDGFPLEGQTEARVECQHCHFDPKPTPTSFVMLNLLVPQKGVTTLNECFDNHFKIEYIDDYKCDKCRLQHAIETLEEEKEYAKSEEQLESIRSKIDRIQTALETDPEKPPERIELPDIKHAPKRKIGRHVEITKFPKVLVLHLSRSVFDPRSSSQKNSAKLSFPEKLPIGGILNRRNYKLLGMVTHRGTHNSGHYETFRRQHLYPPTSTPHVKNPTGPYSPHGSANPSPQNSGDLPVSPPKPAPTSENQDRPSFSSSTPSRPTSKSSFSPPSTRSSSSSTVGANASPHKAIPYRPGDQPTTILSPPPEPRPSSSVPNLARYSASLDVTRFRRKKRQTDRWWRISDDKIKECSTVDVLSMQRDVYMLFYEMERGGDASSSL